MKTNLFVGKFLLLAVVVASPVVACATFTNPIDADPSADAGDAGPGGGSVSGDASVRDGGVVDARTDGSAGGKGGSSGGSGSGGSSGAGSGGGTGSGSAVGSGGAATGSGGSGPVCGNRVVDPGEECDDGNAKDFDGCTNCLADCDKCVRGICTDPNQVGLDLIASCFEMLGTAQGGRAQGTPLADLCTAAVHCALRANCWVNDVSICYCGDTNIVDCQNGSKPPDGDCQAEFEDAAESTTGLDITVRLTDPAWAIGRAGFVLQCAGTFCGSCTNPDHVCGNGILGGAEGCDDGNTTAGDGCSTLCQREVCGNGVIDPGEFCDDGNTLPGDGCPSKCQSCGNGDLDSGEACDDGNELDLDSCTSKCQIDLCGNGVVDSGEGCDDGNRISYDGCSAHCEFCGNRVVDADKGEECDDGNAQSGDGCSVHCKTQLCGNGKVEEGESCDDGNVVAGDGCSVLCAKECGDGVLDKNLEQCDDGNSSDGDGCSSTCRATCGDGFKVGIEECDDGNTKAGDGCGPTCLKE